MRTSRKTSARLKITFVDMTYPKGWTGSLPLCPLIFSCRDVIDRPYVRRPIHVYQCDQYHASFTAHIFDIGYPRFDQLTPVKTRYPLTSIM